MRKARRARTDGASVPGYVRQMQNAAGAPAWAAQSCGRLTQATPGRGASGKAGSGGLAISLGSGAGTRGSRSGGAVGSRRSGVGSAGRSLHSQDVGSQQQDPSAAQAWEEAAGARKGSKPPGKPRAASARMRSRRVTIVSTV